MNPHDEKYDRPGYYWGVKPSPMCFEVLKLMPPDRPLRLLDIGCGEGRNAVFFARNGYEVSAFDVSVKGIEKTLALAERAKVEVRAFQADLSHFRIEEEYDILFSTGVLHYMPTSARKKIMENYKHATIVNGLNVFRCSRSGTIGRKRAGSLSCRRPTPAPERDLQSSNILMP